MSKENLKLFVGGYYDDRIFKGEFFDGKTPFGKNINTYTLDEVIKIPFVEGIKDNNDIDFDSLQYDEKVKAIMDYVEGDEIAGLVYFETENEAELYKNKTLKEIDVLEECAIYIDKEQDEYGNYREVYEYKENQE